MNKRTRFAAVLITATALGVGGLIAVSPAVADSLARPAGTAAGPGPGPGGPGPGPSAGPGGPGPGAGYGMYQQPGTPMSPGTGPGTGPGMGAGPGVGLRDGTCGGLAVTEPQGTLTEAQKSTLAAMAEQEKLSHDLYAAFADKYPAPVFDRIAAAETQHLTAVRTLLDRYGLTDPTADKPAGQFSDPAVQATYDRLLSQGSANQDAALVVGQTVEQTSIDDLQQALEGLTAPDVQQVYTHLLAASRRHLSAFQAWSS